MRARLGGWFIVALATATLGSCGEPADDRIPGPDLLDDPSLEIVETITVTSDGFDPDQVSIVAGEGLELVNDGDQPHGFDGGEDFGTGLLEPGERSTLVLREAGEFPYVDPAEPNHQGTIVVEPDPDAPAPD